MNSAAKRLAARAGLNFNALEGFIPSKIDEPLTQFDFMRATLILARVAENEPQPEGEWQPLNTMPQEGEGAEFWIKRRAYRTSGDRKTVYRVRWSKSGNLITVTRCDPIRLTFVEGWQP